MKKIISVLLVLAISVSCFAINSIAKNDDSIKVIFNIKRDNEQSDWNENSMKFDVEPQIINDRTMVPMRAIFEKFGAVVKWEEATRKITATKDNIVIEMKIDDPVMIANDKNVTLDTAPIIIEDRTLVPLRAISEAFGADVFWYDSYGSKFVGIREVSNGYKKFKEFIESNGEKSGDDEYFYKFDYAKHLNNMSAGVNSAAGNWGSSISGSDKLTLRRERTGHNELTALGPTSIVIVYEMSGYTLALYPMENGTLCEYMISSDSTYYSVKGEFENASITSKTTTLPYDYAGDTGNTRLNSSYANIASAMTKIALTQLGSCLRDADITLADLGFVNFSE